MLYWVHEISQWNILMSSHLGGRSNGDVIMISVWSVSHRLMYLDFWNIAKLSGEAVESLGHGVFLAIIGTTMSWPWRWYLFLIMNQFSASWSSKMWASHALRFPCHAFYTSETEPKQACPVLNCPPHSPLHTHFGNFSLQKEE